MSSAVLSTDEDLRQLVIEDLALDQYAPHERFNHVTRLVASALQAPMAAFTVLTNAQQILQAAEGLEARHTPRDIAFCNHTILTREVVQVEDALSDARFAENPLVTGPPYIRFYAGVSVHAPCGFPVGALCVLDRVPRVLDAHQSALIRDGAAMIQSELLVRKMSVFDRETGFYNREGFLRVIDHAWRRARGLGKTSAMITVAIDGVSRSSGVLVNPMLLRAVAPAITSVCGQPGFVMSHQRPGQFAIFVSGAAAPDVARTAERLRRRLSELTVSGQTVSCSVGYTLAGPLQRSDRSIGDLLERAMSAMRQAADSGGNQIYSA